MMIVTAVQVIVLIIIAVMMGGVINERSTKKGAASTIARRVHGDMILIATAAMTARRKHPSIRRRGIKRRGVQMMIVEVEIVKGLVHSFQKVQMMMKADKVRGVDRARILD